MSQNQKIAIMVLLFVLYVIVVSWLALMLGQVNGLIIFIVLFVLGIAIFGLGLRKIKRLKSKKRELR